MPIPGGHPTAPRVPLRQSTADRIRAAIYDGTLQPGELLIDQELQDWLGVSRTPVREALHELERVGLVEMAPQRYTRVAQPRSEDRTAVLQTVGALVSGVVRVTVPTLDAGQRAELIAFVEHTLATVEARDADGHGRSVWGLVDRFLAHCQNPILVRTTKDVIGALIYRLSVTRSGETTAWDDLAVGYPHLRTAIANGDAVAAELAIEHVFRLQTPLN
ncbi:GntR family transcriptional regulator [Plantibacter flavus]|uniref:GntR family transcriptional regulator n=1 Tax=Plantibacter flavus TaxID=150123 RepID=UPI003F169CD6